MITAAQGRVMKNWAKDRPIEIQGAVRNVCGNLRHLRKSPNDQVLRDKLAENFAVLEKLKAAVTSEE